MSHERRKNEPRPYRSGSKSGPWSRLPFLAFLAILAWASTTAYPEAVFSVPVASIPHASDSISHPTDFITHAPTREWSLLEGFAAGDSGFPNSPNSPASPKWLLRRVGPASATPMTITEVAGMRVPGHCVADFAALFEDSEYVTLSERCRHILRDFRVELVIVTVDEVLVPPQTFAMQLYKRWNIGQEVNNRGLLLLLVAKSNHMEMVRGTGLDANAVASWTEPLRKEGANLTLQTARFSEGITRALVTADQKTRKDVPAPETKGAKSTGNSIGSSPDRLRDSSSSFGIKSFGPLWSWLLVLIIPICIAYARRMLRKDEAQHGCDHCEFYRPKLEETRDNRSLTEGQRFEEKLGAVHYRIYTCPYCEHQREVAFIQWASEFSQCPQCLYRLLKTSSEVLVNATRAHDGLERVTESCMLCEFHSVVERTTPALAPRSQDLAS